MCLSSTRYSQGVPYISISSPLPMPMFLMQRSAAVSIVSIFLIIGGSDAVCSESTSRMFSGQHRRCVTPGLRSRRLCHPSCCLAVIGIPVTMVPSPLKAQDSEGIEAPLSSGSPLHERLIPRAYTRFAFGVNSYYFKSILEIQRFSSRGGAEID